MRLTLSTGLRVHLCRRFYSMFNSSGIVSRGNVDEDYYLNENNLDEIIRNLELRKRTELANALKNDPGSKQDICRKYLHRLPNRLQERWAACEPSEIHQLTLDQLTVRTVGEKVRLRFKAKKAETLLMNKDLFFEANHGDLGLYGGKRAYALLGDAAHMQQAITQWAMDELVNNFGFTPVVVPNLIYEEVIEACGFNPRGQRTQVYKLDGKRAGQWNEKVAGNEDQVSLAGTSEIPLAALHLGHVFDESELPKKYCATSRCYRSEASALKTESGLYRVHYFTKVEMFAVTKKDESHAMLEEFVRIQENLYKQLGLIYRVVDMPPHELGTPAARKFDIETWIISRKQCCEVSSASDCTDYQSRRLNIRYRTLDPNYETNEPFRTEFVSTVNGTAVASPRLLIPLVEFGQTKAGNVMIPEVLQKYMDNKEQLRNLYN